jgi:hypothetical protein
MGHPVGVVLFCVNYALPLTNVLTGGGFPGILVKFGGVPLLFGAVLMRAFFSGPVPGELPP